MPVRVSRWKVVRLWTGGAARHEVWSIPNPRVGDSTCRNKMKGFHAETTRRRPSLSASTLYFDSVFTSRGHARCFSHYQ